MAAAEICPTCGNILTLGTSRVWVRPDGRVAHVKCDPNVSVRDGKAPGPAAQPSKPDDRPVAFLHRSDTGGYYVTLDGIVVFEGPSGTAVGAWKKTQPGIRLEREPEVVAAERATREDRDRRALDRLSNSKPKRSSGTVLKCGTLKRPND